MPSSVTILGSTGSIGLSALRVMKFLGGEFQVYGLSCNKNLSLIMQQIEEYHPSVVAVGSGDMARVIRDRFPGVEFLEGQEGIIELARRDVDILVSAIVGAAGLSPTLEAIPHVKRIALANKETLVMAGCIFKKLIRENGVELIPVDSEHSALFSLLKNVKASDVERIILTASGGSLRDRTAGEMENVTPEEALAHPTWNMGSKITIDSATLMNKGLEVIEAHYLFDMSYDRIDVVMHPESIVHSMVETIDGSHYALMSVPDMALPILNALTHPGKMRNPFGRLDLGRCGRLTFAPCDQNKFPALGLCYHAGAVGGTMPAVLNGANEIAVGMFLEKRIKFTDIVKIVEKTIKLHDTVSDPGIDDIYRADRWARETAVAVLAE